MSNSLDEVRQSFKNLTSLSSSRASRSRPEKTAGARASGDDMRLDRRAMSEEKQPHMPGNEDDGWWLNEKRMGGFVMDQKIKRRGPTRFNINGLLRDSCLLKPTGRGTHCSA